MASLNSRGLALFCLVTILVSAMLMRQVNAMQIDDISVNAHGNPKDNDLDDDNKGGRDSGFEDQKGKLGGDLRVIGH